MKSIAIFQFSNKGSIPDFVWHLSSQQNLTSNWLTGGAPVEVAEGVSKPSVSDEAAPTEPPTTPAVPTDAAPATPAAVTA